MLQAFLVAGLSDWLVRSIEKLPDGGIVVRRDDLKQVSDCSTCPLGEKQSFHMEGPGPHPKADRCGGSSEMQRHAGLS
eukprot:6465670-Amphidinium_carterae.2